MKNPNNFGRGYMHFLIKQNLKNQPWQVVQLDHKIGEQLLYVESLHWQKQIAYRLMCGRASEDERNKIRNPNNQNMRVQIPIPHVNLMEHDSINHSSISCYGLLTSLVCKKAGFHNSSGVMQCVQVTFSKFLSHWQTAQPRWKVAFNNIYTE